MTFRLLPVFLALCLMAGSAAAQEREWTLDASDQDAYLIFGVPESDDVGISMWCPIGQGVVNVFIPQTASGLTAGKTVDMTITAGDETASFKAKTETNEDAGTTSAEAQVAAAHAIFSAMTKADSFKVTVAADEIAFPLFEADVPGLIALCGKK